MASSRVTCVHSHLCFGHHCVSDSGPGSVTCTVCKPLVDCQLAPEVRVTQSLGNCWHGGQAAPSRSWWKRVDRRGFFLSLTSGPSTLGAILQHLPIRLFGLPSWPPRKGTRPLFGAACAPYVGGSPLLSCHHCSSVGHTRLWTPGAQAPCLHPPAQGSERVSPGERHGN